MPSKEIQIPQIGKVTLRKSTRAKHISISIKPFKGVAITLPKWVSYLEGERVLSKRIEWIKNHLEKIKQIEKDSTPTYSNDQLVTKYHRIYFKNNNVDRIIAVVRSEKILISLPNNRIIEEEEKKLVIKAAIERALKVEAKNYLPKRILELSQKFSLSFNDLKIKNIKSRWGSCSYKNNINLCIHLMKLPFDLIDYVILHELVHTKVKNHSSKFWTELEKIYPNCRLADKELRKYGKFVY